MKVCFLCLTHRYNYPRILRMEAQSLSEAGHQVTIIARGGAERFKVGGIDIELFCRPSGMRGRFIGALTLFHRAISKDAKVYHCNEIESWLVGLLVKLFKQDRFVVFDVKEHYSSRFDEPHIARGVRLIGKPVLLLLYRLLPRWTDFFIFAKRGALEDFSNVGCHKYGVVRHYCRVQGRYQKSYVSNSDWSCIDGDRKIAVHVGGFSRGRGWPQLLKALSIMKNQDLEVVCIGSILEGNDALIHEANRLGVSHRVHLYMWVPYEEMLEYVRKSHVGLMLYQPGILNHKWAFPLKMYDYMLEGLPVIGPGFSIEVASVIKELNCGFLIDTSHPNEIANSLDWICENPLASRMMGERGRQGVEEKYNWETESKKLLRIYDDLANTSTMLRKGSIK